MAVIMRHGENMGPMCEERLLERSLLDGAGLHLALGRRQRFASDTASFSSMRSWRTD
jgi:hypothetical protein